MDDSQLVIGVDGGGTKTVAWLAPLEDAENTIVLGRGQAGPGNPRAAGFEIAQFNIDAAITAAFVDAKLPRRSAVAACFGLAGAGRASEQEHISRWATVGQIAAKVQVTGDAEPILAAAAPDNCGIALICGTGSLAFGRNAKGETSRCGGWGYLLGDEGSGYAIGLAGLRSVLLAEDGRGPETFLSELFLPFLGAGSPEQLVEVVYSPEMTRERIASMARTIFLAAKKDGVAGQIIEQAAAELAKMAATLARRLGLASNFRLACAGGVLVAQEAYRERIVQHLAQADFYPEALLSADPVAGAVQLARRLALTW